MKQSYSQSEMRSKKQCEAITLKTLYKIIKGGDHMKRRISVNGIRDKPY